MAERLLTFSIFRYDPDTPEIRPRMQEFQLEETMGMSLFIALNRLREEQDPLLQGPISSAGPPSAAPAPC